MRAKFLAASLVTALAQNFATAAPAPSLLTPSGPWHVEYAGSMCLLGRPYGPQQATRLILKPSMIGDKLELIVLTKGARKSSSKSGHALLVMGGKPFAGEADFFAYSTATARLVRIGTDDESLSLAALSNTLLIDAQGESRHSFALTGFDRARPALDSCLQKLRGLFNVTDADLAPIKTEPKGDLLRFFSSSDYPRDALDKGQSGAVGVLLWIETDGRASKCEVIEPIDSLALQQQTCNILKQRGRFTPATDASGNPIRSPVTARIRWLLPR